MASKWGRGAWKAWLAAAIAAAAALPGINDVVGGLFVQLGLPDATQSLLWAAVGYIVVWAKSNAPHDG